MHLFRGALASVVCGVLTLTLAPSSGATTSAPDPAPASSRVSEGAVPLVPQVGERRTRAYRVGSGITFNSPIGSRAAKLTINAKIIGAINHARRGSYIKIMTWNFMSASAKDALLNAQRRGVKIQLLMDASNVTDETPNPQFKQLRWGLAKGNQGRRADRRSAARTCAGSCRGSRGAAHSKYFLFSRVGASSNVVMQGSANLTTAAAYNQWNEIFTWVDNTRLWQFSNAVFNQMWLDKAQPQPYMSVASGRSTLTFSPYSGPAYRGDPVQKALNAVKCRGAVRAGNAAHRTIVRSAPDVMRGRRGMTAAKRLKTLWNYGCDVRVVYTVMGMDVRKVLASRSGRGPVPMRHLVQDFNGDGAFDNYFHIKVLTINGVLGSNKTAFVSFNGSSNTSDLSSASDENIGTFRSRPITLRYQKHIDYWFDHKPADGNSGGSATTSTGGAAGRVGVIDPYMYVDLD